MLPRGLRQVGIDSVRYSTVYVLQILKASGLIDVLFGARKSSTFLGTKPN